MMKMEKQKSPEPTKVESFKLQTTKWQLAFQLVAFCKTAIQKSHLKSERRHFSGFCLVSVTALRGKEGGGGGEGAFKRGLEGGVREESGFIALSSEFTCLLFAVFLF